MYLHPKQLIFAVIFIVFYSGAAFSESNFDFFFKSAERYKDVIVNEVLSTNTIRLKEKIGDKGEIIRLIGLRVPNSPKRKNKKIERDQFGFVKKKPVTPLTSVEEKAFEFARELLEGQHVRLEFDADKKGEKQTTLAYIFLLKDDTFVNAEILRHGFAHLSIRPPNTKYAKELRAAYREAFSEKRGLQGQ